MSTEPELYTTVTGNTYDLNKVSKAFLKNQIEYLNHANPESVYLPLLKKILKEKSKIIFKFTL